MYNAIPDKYKEMWYDAIPVEYKKQECVWHTPIVTSVRSYLGFYKMIDEKYLPQSKASSEQIKDMILKSATKPFNLLLACTCPLVTEFADNLN